MTAPFLGYGLVFGISLILSLILTPLSIRLGERWGLVAIPGGRRKHARPVSRIGGVPVYIAFVTAVLASQLLIVTPWGGSGAVPESLAVLRTDPKEIFRLIGLLLGGTIIFVVGLYDDWRELPPAAQYMAQLAAAAVAVAFLIVIEYVSDPFSGSQTPDFAYVATVTISIFWLGLMMNTVNWLDGLDGLAVGVVAVACIVLFANAVFRLEPPQHSVAVLPVALLGALVGFLPFNFSPARVFLGSGAYFLGFTLGALSIIGGAKMAAILLVMGLPMLDLAWQVVNRLSRGKNPVQGDRGHLHFRLADMGLSQRVVALGYYAFSAAFGGLALFIPSRLYKLVAMVIIILLSVVGFIWLSKRTPTEPDAQDPED